MLSAHFTKLTHHCSFTGSATISCHHPAARNQNSSHTRSQRPKTLARRHTVCTSAVPAGSGCAPVLLSANIHHHHHIRPIAPAVSTHLPTVLTSPPSARASAGLGGCAPLTSAAPGVHKGLKYESLFERSVFVGPTRRLTLSKCVCLKSRGWLSVCVCARRVNYGAAIHR